MNCEYDSVVDYRNSAGVSKKAPQSVFANSFSQIETKHSVIGLNKIQIKLVNILNYFTLDTSIIAWLAR